MKNNRNVPFCIPDISDLETKYVIETLKSGWITTGLRTKEFERKLAGLVGTQRVVCLNSQTVSAEVCMRILGIGEGDEVITCAYTYTATASAAIHVGAKVVLVDCSMKSSSIEMDYEALEKAITEKTKIIVPIDLAGIPCDYEQIYRIVERKRHMFHPTNGIQEAIGHVVVVADAAHALGASYHCNMVGSVADFTNFSFHAVKNITTAEGGAMTWRTIPGIDNEEIYRQAQLLSQHGQNKDAFAKDRMGTWEYDIVGPWYKYNMTDISAAIGLAQLERYPDMLARRREIINSYENALKPLGVAVLNHYTDEYISSGHLYITRVFKNSGEAVSDVERREIMAQMAEQGISTNVHYKPLPLHTAYRNLGFDAADYPHSIARYENEITLPLYSKLTDEQVEYVIESYIKIIRKYS